MKTEKRRSAKPPKVSYNSETGFVVVELPPRNRFDGATRFRSARELMKQVDDHRKTIGITMSRLGREAKVVDGAVVRALYGHRDSEKARLKKHTQDGPGRVHFTTLLAILHALDLDIEIVSRS